MGVPAFFRWLSKKYPAIVTHCEEGSSGLSFQFDNLYLDMNGIIHPCTHPENRAPPETEEEMFEAIFEYIERIMKMAKPKKVLYMAVDGVAPRAKMNQQRSRRFRASKENIEKKIEMDRIKDELKNRGVQVDGNGKKGHFDSNVITPGTQFMINLSHALIGWIDKKLSPDNEDPYKIWPKGLIVILSDASVPGEGEHKIQEYIRKQKAQPDYNPNISHCLFGADADLIHLGLATHELDFTILREEFIPNQPRPCEICSQIGHEMKDCEGKFRDPDEPPARGPEPGFIFIRISVLREYLFKECDPQMGLDFERFIDDFVFLCFFVGNDFLPHLPSLEIREGAIDRLMAIYRNIQTKCKSPDPYLTEHGFVNLKRVQLVLNQLGEVEDEIFKRRKDNDQRFKERMKRQKLMNNRNNGQGVTNVNSGLIKLKRHECQETPAENAAQLGSEGTVKGKEESSDSEPEDSVQLGAEGWKDRYYYHKFDCAMHTNISQIVAREYVLGLCWVLRYYYQGCPDWQWFYPFHYAPFASDFVDIEYMAIEFKREAKPFKPLEQLMAVFPAASSENLPPSWRLLMTDPNSPIVDFYPGDFHVDLNGKRAAWMGVAILPFIDEERLSSALREVYPYLSDEEKARNSLGPHLLFASINKGCTSEFLKEVVSGSSSAQVDVNPEIFDGMGGKISKSERHSQRCRDSFCVEYYDPLYPNDFVFRALRLKSAVAPPTVLKPRGCFDNSRQPWRPTTGINAPNPRPHRADQGNRNIQTFSPNRPLAMNQLNHSPNSPFGSPRRQTGHQRSDFESLWLTLSQVGDKQQQLAGVAANNVPTPRGRQVSVEELMRSASLEEPNQSNKQRPQEEVKTLCNQLLVSDNQQQLANAVVNHVSTPRGRQVSVEELMRNASVEGPNDKLQRELKTLCKQLFVSDKEPFFSRSVMGPMQTTAATVTLPDNRQFATNVAANVSAEDAFEQVAAQALNHLKSQYVMQPSSAHCGHLLPFQLGAPPSMRPPFSGSSSLPTLPKPPGSWIPSVVVKNQLEAGPQRMAESFIEANEQFLRQHRPQGEPSREGGTAPGPGPPGKPPFGNNFQHGFHSNPSVLAYGHQERQHKLHRPDHMNQRTLGFSSVSTNFNRNFNAGGRINEPPPQESAPKLLGGVPNVPHTFVPLQVSRNNPRNNNRRNQRRREQEVQPSLAPGDPLLVNSGTAGPGNGQQRSRNSGRKGNKSRMAAAFS